MDAILPITMARPDPQIIYLSNAGDDDSLVLNELRGRRDSDRRLAYLEWSAAEDRALDDPLGWAEANPSLNLSPLTTDTMEAFLAKGPPASFETENLCRWVISMKPRLVSDAAWQLAHGKLEPSRRPSLAISMDPSGKRASAAIAWLQGDGTIGLRVIADVTGDPIDTDRLGPDLRQAAVKLGTVKIAFDPWTDKELARHLRIAKPLTGQEFANASENFVRVIESGRLRWDDADAVSYDLAWTARKAHETGAWSAVRARDDRPITASLAAIRAVWLASGPKPSVPKVL
jgi:phage terminase large subunit-like protein